MYVGTKKFQCAIKHAKDGALDRAKISGLTHTYYRYPARFSPTFARNAIEAFSNPGDIVLDPYMGGGTSVIEAMVAGRNCIGTDINSLAVFVTQVKTEKISTPEQLAISNWANTTVPNLRCNSTVVRDSIVRPRNVNLPSVKFLWKFIEICLGSIEEELPTARAQRMARCGVLNAGQWALNGCRKNTNVSQLRDRIMTSTNELLAGAEELKQVLSKSGVKINRPLLRELDTENIHKSRAIENSGPVDLVVCSPPYPGIHMLYHRWQVDGRKETDAPYHIAQQNDGCGVAYYNFADRRRNAEEIYFQKARRAFTSIRKVMRRNAILVQLIAFAEPTRQLRRYLNVMEDAGFVELREEGKHRAWRDVPSRKWHANSKGNLPGSREVMLVHRAN